MYTTISLVGGTGRVFARAWSDGATRDRRGGSL